VADKNLKLGNASKALSTSNLVSRYVVGRSKDPLPTFRFVVEINGLVVGAFTECKLPHIAWKPQKIYEGGLNTYTHQLIGQRKPAKITMKRGLGVTSHLLDWYVQTMKGQIEAKQVTVKLLNSFRQSIITWSIEGAYPMKWSGLKLNTKSKTIAISTLMLACGYIDIETSDEL
jgi:phage tail-like protein